MIGQADDLARETCASTKNGVDILPDAPAQLGGLVGFSQTGDSGYGCGGPALGKLYYIAKSGATSMAQWSDAWVSARLGILATVAEDQH